MARLGFCITLCVAAGVINRAFGPNVPTAVILLLAGIYTLATVVRMIARKKEV